MKLYKILLIIIYSVFYVFPTAYISVKNGFFDDTATWNSLTTPGVGDSALISSDDTVTIRNNCQIGDGGATGANAIRILGKLILNTNCSLAVRRDMHISGTVYQNPGSAIRFKGVYYCYMNNNSVWDIDGVENNYSIVDDSINGLAIKHISSSNLINLDWRYTKANKLGQSSSIYSVYFGSSGVASSVKFNHCLFSNCYQFNFDGNGSESVNYTMGFDSCTFISPAYSKFFKFSSVINFSAGKKYITNCVFIGTASFQQAFSHTGDISYTNPFIFKNNVMEDCYISNGSGCNMLVKITAHSKVASTNQYITTGVKQNACIIDSSILYAKSSSSHPIQMAITPIRITTNRMMVKNSFIWSLSTNTNTGNSIFLESAGDYINNVTIGGNGLYFQDAGDSLASVLIDRHTHINIDTISQTSGNRDALFLSEVAPGRDTITLRSCMVIGTNRNKSAYERIAEGYAGTQTILYSDYHNVYNVHASVSKYADVNILGDSSIHDVSINPNFSSSGYDTLIQQFDLINGGTGNVDSVWSRMIELNGINRSGATATFNPLYNPNRLYKYLYWALTPHNTNLRGTGYGGVTPGALNVIDTITVKNGTVLPGVDTIMFPCSLSTILDGDSGISYLFSSPDQIVWTKQDSTAWVVGGTKFNLVARNLEKGILYYLKDSTATRPILSNYNWVFIDTVTTQTPPRIDSAARWYGKWNIVDTLYGIKFKQSGLTIKLNNRSCPVIYQNDTFVSFRIPYGKGQYPFIIKNSDSLSDTSDSKFRYKPVTVFGF